jgi:hypothetical protein
MNDLNKAPHSATAASPDAILDHPFPVFVFSQNDVINDNYTAYKPTLHISLPTTLANE